MVIETSQKRKRLNYLAAFSVTALILIIGIFIGWQFTNYKFKNFQYEQEKLNLLIIGLDLKETIINEPGCDLDIDRLMEDKVRVGGDVGLLEERLGKENKDVLLKKEFYQLVEVKTILLLNKISEECDLKYNIILFFYSNDEGDRLEYKQSQDQGYILDNLYSRNKDKIAVFSFDINNKNPALILFRDKYNVKKAPTMVINGKIYEGMRGLTELESFIKK